MPKQLDTIETCRALMAEYRHDEAESLLDKALAGDPKNPDLWAELGLVYAHTQREVQAVELLGKAWGGTNERKLAQLLVDHFECRKRMARRLCIADEFGKRLLLQTRTLTGLKPGIVGIKLSACLIVRNEAAHLERCLDSIKDVVDEIVVVDTGSTDETVAIAERYGARIGHFEWCDDFAMARNESLKLAAGDWALWIDADESLDPKSFSGIREGLMRPHFGGYYIKIVNYMDQEGEANQYVHAPIRLFRLTPDTQFTGAIHEQIAPSLSKLGLAHATLENALIHHYGYRPSEMESKDKMSRTLSMLNKQVEAEPDVAFHWFNLANAHTVAADYASAAEAAVQCIERLDENNAFGSLTYQLLQTALIELGRPEESLLRAEEASAKGFAGILTEFERAHALSRLGRFESALEAIDNCFALEWPRDLTGDYGIVTHKRHLLKGQILAQMGRLDEAIPLLDHVQTHDAANAAAIYAKGAVLEKFGRFDDALRCFERVLESKDQGWAARKGAARILLVTGDPGKAAKLAEQCWRERPKDLDSWSLWLAGRESGGDFEGACEAYEVRLTQDEPTADLLVNYGRLLQPQEPKSALNCFMEAVRIDPTHANAYFNCGDLLYAAGNYSEAASAYQAGLKHQPDFAQGWFVLGNCFAQLGSTEGALFAYDHVLNLDPNHQEARHNRAMLTANAA